MTEQTNQQAHEHEEEHVCNSQFDLQKEYEEQVIPLMEALHAKCRELEIPVVIGICFMDKDGKLGQGAAFNNGGCRAPKEYYVAMAAIEQRIPDPVLAMAAITAKRSKK